MPTVVVRIEGGTVSDVFTDADDLTVLVVDYDVEESSAGEIVEYRGDTCRIYEVEVRQDEDEVEEVYEYV